MAAVGISGISCFKNAFDWAPKLAPAGVISAARQQNANIDFSGSSEDALLRGAVSKVVADFGHEYFGRQVKADGHTTELWEALGESGFIGVNLPEEYGGGGRGIAELAIVCEESAYGGCPLLLLLVSAAICGEVLKEFGSAEQKQRWLPSLAAGTERMVFAITECSRA